MFNADVIFLHAPSIYDFRKRAVLHGPISDVVPSSPIFEMYPIGFLSLCGHLENAGFSTRIINIANKMLGSLSYDPEKEIAGLRPKAFAIDLHWLPHVQGSLKIGEIVKKHHPDIPVIYGGYSATYFHEELIRYPFVDYVLRGDSTEGPLVQLIEALDRHENLSRTPNLTYKDRNGDIFSNEMSYLPMDADQVLTEFELPMKKTLRFFDPKGYSPFQSWTKYPVTAVFPYRGCLHNCKTCGGSRFTCEQVFNRTTLSTKAPEKVAAELKASETYFNAPCMIIGDILQPGRAYADQLLDEMKKLHLKNEIAFEFFVPPTEEFLIRLKESVPKYNVEISPEAHDEEIRRAFGRPFNNQQLEDSIQACIKHDCRRIDLFFMIGLPKQTYTSVMETINYCEYLLNAYGRKENLHPFIAPLAPFIDPGSQVWEDPEKYGYRLFARTLEEHRQMMDSALSWKYFLNYETRWMTRDEIVSATYEAGLRLNELKRRHGLISEKMADVVENRAKTAVKYLKLLDEILRKGEEGKKDLESISREIRDYSVGTICDKEELNWPIRLYKYNIFKILGSVIRAGAKKLFKRRHLFGASRYSVTLTAPDKQKGLESR